MPRRLASLVVALLAPAVACGARDARWREGPPREARGEELTKAAASPSPPVVVTIVVDQLAAWIARERFSLLPDSGGFARLRREGTWADDVRYAHAVTDTAPGHAALYTGATPRVNGVFANEVPDERGERVSIVADPHTRLVTADASARATDAADARGAQGERVSASLARVPRDVSTLADELRAADGRAVILSLSLKDRGAVFGGGRRPTASLWMDSGVDGFVTSTAFAPKGFPSWAAPLAGHAAMEALRAWRWEPLSPSWLRGRARAPDAQPGEGDLAGLGRVFPHDFTRTSDPRGAMRASPAADEALFALALAGLDAEVPRASASGPSPHGSLRGRAVRPRTLVALSLSTNDYVGHVFGPDSWEAWDELARLDAALGRFFAALDARYGEAGWNALVTADHGVAPLPEIERAPCSASDARVGRPCGVEGLRLSPDTLARELKDAARAELGDAGLVLAVIDPWIYLGPAARRLDVPRRARLDAVVRGAIARGHPEVRGVYALDELFAVNAPAELHEAAARDAGDYYVVTRPGSFFDALYVPGAGTSHGTPYAYDRSVPLLVRAPGRVRAGAVEHAALPWSAFARTAASLLDVAPPPAARAAPALVER